MIDNLKKSNSFLVLLKKKTVPGSITSILSKEYLNVFDVTYDQYDQSSIKDLISKNRIDISNSYLLTNCNYAYSVFSNFGIQLKWIGDWPMTDPLDDGYKSYGSSDAYRWATHNGFSHTEVKIHKAMHHLSQKYLFYFENGEQVVSEFFNSERNLIAAFLNRGWQLIKLHKIKNLASFCAGVNLPKCKYPTLFFVIESNPWILTTIDVPVLPPYNTENIRSQMQSLYKQLASFWVYY